MKVRETRLKVADPLVGDALPLPQEHHIGEMDAGLVPGDQGRMAFGKLAVHDEDDPAQFAALAVNPRLHRLHLIDRVHTPVRHEEDRLRARRHEGDDEALRVPAPPGDRAQLRVEGIGLLGFRKEHATGRSFLDHVRREVRKDFPAAGAGRAQYHINQGFFRHR